MSLPVFSEYKNNPCEILPLTTGKGEKERVPFRSGLNWRQRPRRNQNQAYLSIPVDVQKSKFFPEKGVEFKAIADDEAEFTFVRAQANGKGIHSLPANDLIGAYFRSRLKVESGEMIVLTHLLLYGRTTVDFYKIDDGFFFMDFSVR